jgi:hypothetical protein
MNKLILPNVFSPKIPNTENDSVSAPLLKNWLLLYARE